MKTFPPFQFLSFKLILREVKHVIELRRFHRYPLMQPSSLLRAGQEHLLLITDVSLGGLQGLARHPLGKGDEVIIGIKGQEDTQRYSAQVCHSAVRDGVCTFGARFLFRDPLERRVITEFVHEVYLATTRRADRT